MEKLRKWIIPLIVVLAAAISGSTAYGADSDLDYSIMWEDDEAESVYIYGYHGSEENLIIPEEIDGYKVKYVYLERGDYEEGGSAEVNTTVKSIHIPSGTIEFEVSLLQGLTDISISGDNEYFEEKDGLVYAKPNEYSGLRLYCVPPARTGTIDIMEGTETAGYSSFSGCDRVLEINIPASFTEIRREMAEDCKLLESINVAEDNQYFSSENGVLYDKQKKSLIWYPCGKIGEVNIADSVTEIGDMAFMDCVNISEISLGKNVSIIGEYVFMGCTSLQTAAFEGIVTKIGDCTFAGCKSLTEVILPDGIESLSYAMFYECPLLKKINIPASVKVILPTSIKESGINEIVIDDENPYLSLKDKMICNKEGTKLFLWLPDGQKNITVPDNITVLGENSFSLCIDAEKITVPENVTELETGVFQNCWLLKEIELPEGIKTIPDNTFNSCENLQSIKIPSTVTSIGYGAFDSCYSLKSLTIPENVTNLESRIIFLAGITEVYVESLKLTDIGDFALSTYMDMVNVYVYNEEVYNKLKENSDEFCNIILLKKSEPLELDKYSVELYTGNVKKSVTVKAALTDITGTVKWKTSDKSVANVKNGKITAVNKGTAVVTAYIGKYSKKVKVTVRNPVITVVDGSESINTIKVKRGKSVYYRVNTNPSKSGIKLKLDKNIKKYAKVALKNNTLSVKGVKKGTVKFRIQSGKGIKTVKINVR